MSDPIRVAEQLETIKRSVNPDYKTPERVDSGVPEVAEQAVAGMLSLENPNARDKDKLSFIATQIKGESQAEALYQLRQIEQRLMPPKLGERRVDVLYNYLRAKQAVVDAEKLRDTYLG